MTEMKMAIEVTRELEKRGVRAVMQRVNKNGIERYGISMGDGNVKPTVYIDDLDASIEETAEKMHRIYIRESSKLGYISDMANGFQDYDSIKDKIIPCVMKAKVNEYLTKPYLDLNIYYRVMIEDMLDSPASIIIKKDHIKLWNVTEEEIYEQAIENTKGTYKVKSMLSILCEKANITEEEAMMMGIPDGEMFVITNDSGLYGAGALVHEDIFKNLMADLKDDLWIIPSSVHELIIVPKKMGDEENMTSMIQEVNATEVEPVDFLSDHVYKCEKKVVIS